MTPPDDPPDAPAPEPSSRVVPRTVGGAFYLVILAVAAGGVALAYADDWRLGVRVLAGALGAAALLRLVLPQRHAGMLAVRHRAVDVVLLAAVCGVLWWLVGSIPDQP